MSPSDPHTSVSTLPKHLRTRKAIKAAPTDALNDLMGWCHAEPAEPKTCLPCLAYMVVLERERSAVDRLGAVVKQKERYSFEPMNPERDIRHTLYDVFQRPGDFEIELREDTREIVLTLKDGTQLTAVVDKIRTGK